MRKFWLWLLCSFVTRLSSCALQRFSLSLSPFSALRTILLWPGNFLSFPVKKIFLGMDKKVFVLEHLSHFFSSYLRFPASYSSSLPNLTDTLRPARSFLIQLFILRQASTQINPKDCNHKIQPTQILYTWYESDNVHNVWMLGWLVGWGWGWVGVWTIVRMSGSL